MKYGELVEVYQKLESTSKRLEKTHLISELLKKTPIEELSIIMLLLQGRIYPTWDERKLGVAGRLVLKAINIASGIHTNEIEEIWKKLGDLGLAAEKIIGRKKQNTLFSQDLTIKKVFENLKKLAGLEGQGTVDRKIKLIAELLTSARSSEAKYITRTILEELRVGVGEGSIRDAIIWAFFSDKLNINYNKEENDLNFTDEERKEYNKYVDAVQEAYDITNDFSEVAVIAKQKGIEGLNNVSLEVGKPIKAMLYQKAKDMEDAFSIVGKPAILEFKYDGFRCITGLTPLYIKNKGFISIRDIKEGDYVLTHRGNFRRIKAINKRTIDKSEKLFEIQSFYGNKFRISERHPILIYKGKLSWVNIEFISKGDKLVFPIPHLNAKFPYKNDFIFEGESGYSKTIKINDFFFRFLGYWIGDGYTNNYHNTERVGLIYN